MFELNVILMLLFEPFSKHKIVMIFLSLCFLFVTFDDLKNYIEFMSFE